MANVEEMRKRLMEALRPADKSKTRQQSADELSSVRKECRKLGIDYSKLLIEVCQVLSSARKKDVP